jgi:dephospho-CoA kinase
MLVIAVTGGIGSGKSSVAELFKEKGIPVIDTDVIARQLVQPGSPLLSQIIREFGHEYLDSDGQLKRKELSKLIFTTAAAREKLETLLHPAIHARVIEQLQAITSPYCLLLIPLLARSKQSYPYDRVLVIDVPQQIQIARTVQREKLAPDFVRQIIATQPTRNELLAMADDVLDNSSDMAALSDAIAKLHQHYLFLAAKKA